MIKILQGVVATQTVFGGLTVVLVAVVYNLPENCKSLLTLDKFVSVVKL